MKQAEIDSGKVQPQELKRFWVAWVGVPIATLLLLATQSDLRSRVELFSSQALSQVDAPYRYPFPDALSSSSSPVARLEQEVAFYQKRTRENAQSAIDRADLALAYLRMARTTGAGNWYLLADETAQQSLVLLPFDNQAATAVLARVAEARHDFAGALRLAAQIPQPEEALGIQVTSNLARGKLDAARQAVDQLVDLTLSMNAFTLQALVKTAQGKDQEALQSFQQGLAVEESGDLSNSARTRVLIGRFYYERGQLELAENLYHESLRILPNNPQALINLAQLEIRRGRYGVAEQLYSNVTLGSEGNPTVFDPLVLRGRARIKLLQGDRPGADQLWGEAETLLRQSFTDNSTGSFGHRRDLAGLLLEQGRSQDVAEAVSLMKTEVTWRRDAETLDTYAWALVRDGQLQAAQTVIQEAIAQGVRNAGIFDRAGSIEQALGHPSSAQTYVQKAQEVDAQFNDAARRALNLGLGLGS
jgi:tetratricopeptide (TPR) repeat protein